MFFSLFTDPIQTLIALATIIVTVSVHEAAHAKTADSLGDPTPRLAGRVTLNPAAHLDLMGSLLFLFFGFGWGKPVPFDAFNLRNPRKDAALISIAGPSSNFILALLCSLFLHLFNFSGYALPVVIGYIFLWLIHWNVILGIFNLLPFAPLDGFKFVGGLLTERQAREWYTLERYGMFFLLFFILPLSGGRSMLELFILPIVQMVTGLLIP